MPVALWVSLLSSPYPAIAQSALDRGVVQPMGQWVEFAQAYYTGDPVAVHLRTGYERAVIMPEPVSAHAQNPLLPHTEVIVENEVVGFYPEESFKAISLKFVGAHSGTVFELQVNSSTTGTRQPLQINR